MLAIKKTEPEIECVQHKRPMGLAVGTLELSDEFFEPLPDDILKAFYAED